MIFWERKRVEKSEALQDNKSLYLKKILYWGTRREARGVGTDFALNQARKHEFETRIVDREEVRIGQTGYILRLEP